MMAVHVWCWPVLNGAVLAHNPEVAGSNPAPATRKYKVRGLIAGNGGRALIFVAARRQQDLAAPAGQEDQELAENGSGVGQTCMRPGYLGAACRTGGGGSVGRYVASVDFGSCRRSSPSAEWRGPQTCAARRHLPAGNRATCEEQRNERRLSHITAPSDPA
jgi:hypothetical protein